MAVVPESVNRAMETSSLRRRKVLYPASTMAFSSSAWLGILTGSTTLILNGSAHVRLLAAISPLLLGCITTLASRAGAMHSLRIRQQIRVSEGYFAVFSR